MRWRPTGNSKSLYANHRDAESGGAEAAGGTPKVTRSVGRVCRGVPFRRPRLIANGGSHNTSIQDSDSTRFVINVIGGNLGCRGNSPAVQVGDSGGCPTLLVARRSESAHHPGSNAAQRTRIAEHSAGRPTRGLARLVSHGTSMSASAAETTSLCYRGGSRCASYPAPLGRDWETGAAPSPRARQRTTTRKRSYSQRVAEVAVGADGSGDPGFVAD
jgi:hypothetical protein